MKAARGKKSSACTTSAVRDVLPAAATVAIPAQIGRAFRGDLLQETPDSRSVGDGCRRRLAVDRHACLPRLLPGTSGTFGCNGHLHYDGRLQETCGERKVHYGWYSDV